MRHDVTDQKKAAGPMGHAQTQSVGRATHLKLRVGRPRRLVALALLVIALAVGAAGSATSVLAGIIIFPPIIFFDDRHHDAGH